MEDFVADLMKRLVLNGPTLAVLLAVLVIASQAMTMQCALALALAVWCSLLVVIKPKSGHVLTDLGLATLAAFMTAFGLLSLVH